jgi:hypothetical protein
MCADLPSKPYLRNAPKEEINAKQVTVLYSAEFPVALMCLYCDVFGRMPALLGNRKVNTLVVARQLQVGHFHGYACRPGTVA